MNGLVERDFSLRMEMVLSALLEMLLLSLSAEASRYQWKRMAVIVGYNV